ncbi:MAG: cysteine desulfurase family protein [Thermoleophilia bacterium]
MNQSIYFDHAATTPLDPRVRETMLPFLGESFGNPSSLHGAGRVAHAAVDQARAEVADLIGARPTEIVFTASGSEADNLALRGVMERQGGHVVVSAFEHPAVIETCKYLTTRGVKITQLPIDADGIVQPESLVQTLRPDTRLVSVMTANNVVGTIQPVTELARIAKEHGALFHTDAVQAAGKLPLDVSRLNVDLLSLSAHKFHGPQGVGALYVRAGVQLTPIVFGGGQERGLRSATENVPGIVGFGRAAHIAGAEMAAEAVRLVALRDRLMEAVTETIPNVYFIGHPYMRLPGHLCLGFAGQEGDAVRLLLELDARGIAVSSGSACSSNHVGEPSYVLASMGLDQIRARGSLRITLGRFTTVDEVDEFLHALPDAVASLRTIASHAGFAVRT